MRRLQGDGGPTVYAIGILEREEHPKHARRALQIMSERTGGLAFFPKTLDELDAISRTVAHDIRTQYTIGYKPTTPKYRGAIVKSEWTPVHTTTANSSSAPKAGITLEEPLREDNRSDSELSS